MLGAEYFHTIETSSALRHGALCDVYFEAGGRAFDTAFAYADGHSEACSAPGSQAAAYATTS